MELEHLHGSSPQLFAALRHSLSRAYHTKDHTKRSKKVRRKSEESPKKVRRFRITRTSPELQFLLHHAKHGCRNRPRSPGYALAAATPGGLPGLRLMPKQAVAKHHCHRLRWCRFSARPGGCPVPMARLLGWRQPVRSARNVSFSSVSRNEVCSGQKGTIKGCRSRFTALMPHSAVEMAKRWQWKSDFMT